MLLASTVITTSLPDGLIPTAQRHRYVPVLVIWLRNVLGLERRNTCDPSFDLHSILEPDRQRTHGHQASALSCTHVNTMNFSPHENRSPFGLRNGTGASYLLFSNTLSCSVVGACRVGAGSLLASWLGDPAVSVRTGVAVPGFPDPPIVAEENGRLGTLLEYSRDSTADFFRLCSSRRAWRSALIWRLAKT
jgi:hypothetical protein